MVKAIKCFQRKSSIFLLAWIAYTVLIFHAFPFFSITCMQFSVALAMLGAWLYGFPGCIATTVLTIPLHYLMLTFHSDDPAIYNEAFNPFGISTQLLISATVALVRHTRKRLEQLNATLEQKVKERTEELNRLQHFIVQNRETTQSLLGRMLLNDIGNSLAEMEKEGDLLPDRPADEKRSTSTQKAKLKELIRESIDEVRNLEFGDHFFTSTQSGYAEAARSIARHYSETVGTGFDLQIEPGQGAIPKHIEHQLYRITQEAVTNAVRHAESKHIAIHLATDADTCRLSVINDGLPLPEKIESGLGMRLMKQRTRQLGGDLQWKTTPDKKTLLQCRIPNNPEYA